MEALWPDGWRIVGDNSEKIIGGLAQELAQARKRFPAAP